MRKSAHVRPRLGRLKNDESGIALLMVLVTIAMLSAVVMEFVHQTRINVQMAANVRDRIKAYYMARSAVNFSRLILFFQGQVDRMTQGAVKLYQLVPIESDLAKALTSGEIGEAFGLEGANLGDVRGFGEFDGGFSAIIEDEYAKINLNSLNSLPSIASPTAAQILTLIGSARHQEMFEKPDADGKYTTPGELVAAIHDWIDADNTTDSFQPNVLATNPISHIEIFTQGSSSEDSNYDMLDDPYKAKNISRRTCASCVAGLPVLRSVRHDEGWNPVHRTEPSVARPRHHHRLDDGPRREIPTNPTLKTRTLIFASEAKIDLSRVSPHKKTPSRLTGDGVWD